MGRAVLLIMKTQCLLKCSESKFKQAKDFLHAKHSKGTQVDILPLLRLQDVELLIYMLISSLMFYNRFK